MPGIYLFLAGMAGAIVKDVLADNKLVLPKFQDGCIVLGFLGGAVIGGFAGSFVDGSIETAFLGGLAGRQIIESLLPKPKAVK